MGPYRIGVDIGGTFTDFSIMDEATGRLDGLKVPTVRARPVDGVMAGLDILARERGVTPEAIGTFVHGTTIAVNTLIERDGARLGLLVTRGFRDLLILQRLRMTTPQDWRTGRPVPLIPRRAVFELEERLRADGSTEVTLSAADVRAAVQGARAQSLQGLVVCLLHAYRNPTHERAAAELIAEAAPELFLCCSHQVWPRMREYERATISIINAYVMPRVDGYLADLETRLAQRGVAARPFVTQSGGGIMTAASARLSPAETLLSGPAAGVIGATLVAAAAGIGDFVTLDIGGTSADVAFVEDGQPRISQGEHVAAFPVMMPVIGVSSIGAGGGSVISVDGMGVLRVGPESVGSDPGPACYGRGGVRPAISDVFLLAGLLNPETFAGGRVRLSPERAEAALAPVARSLGLDEHATVAAVLRVAVAALHAELSNLAARQGCDLADYWLLPFGGAGPLLACQVAEEAGMDRILVPPSPGTLCSLGALSADVAKSVVRSIAAPLSACASDLSVAYRALLDEAEAWLRRDAPEIPERRLTLSADMRYLGQSYEIDVALDPEDVLAGRADAIAEAFHVAHERRFTHSDRGAGVELIDLRLLIAGVTPKPPLASVASDASAKAPGRRLVAIDGVRRTVEVHAREGLTAGTRLAGPALIDEADSTVLLRPGWRAEVHASGSLLLRREGEAQS